MRLHTLHDRGPGTGRVIMRERRHMAIMAALIEQNFIWATRFRQLHRVRRPAFRATSRQQSIDEEKKYTHLRILGCNILFVAVCG